MARRCQHSLGSPPPLRPKRAAQTAAQGFAPADSPTTTANQKKGDTSNEVRHQLPPLLPPLTKSITIPHSKGDPVTTSNDNAFNRREFIGGALAGVAINSLP